MTACCIDTLHVPAVHRPWWQRWLDRAREGPEARAPSAAEPASWRPSDLRQLRHLGARTLQDIGVPDWVAVERDAAQRLRLELMRL